MKLRISVLLLVLSANATAFDVDGFSTGMTKAAVLSKAEKSYKVVNVDESTFIANAGDGGYLSFNFCEGKLAAVQKGFPADLKQVTLLVSEFKDKHGNPFSTSAGTRAGSTGPIYELGMWWNAGNEFVNIYYMGTGSSEGLSTSHQARNSCFKVPR